MEGTPDPGIDKVNVRVLPDGRMTRRDAARYLGYEPKTLAMWHLEGKRSWRSHLMLLLEIKDHRDSVFVLNDLDSNVSTYGEG